jgi:hypothetical protein
MPVGRMARGQMDLISEKISKIRFLKSIPVQIRQLILFSTHKLTHLKGRIEELIRRLLPTPQE